MNSRKVNLFGKYKNMSNTVKVSFWYMFCTMIQRGISFITVPIFTRILTVEQYGIITIYNSWHTMLLPLVTLNLFYGVYNNLLTKYPEKKMETTSALLGLSTFTTIVFFLLYLVNVQFWNKIFGLSTLIMVVMFISILLFPSYTFWIVSQRYDYKYIKSTIVSLVIALSSPILGVLMVVLIEEKAEARIIAFVFVQGIIGLIFYVYYFLQRKNFFNKEYWKFALKFNVPLIPHYLSTNILSQADRIMINLMVSETATAIYGVAYTVSLLTAIITNAINSSYIPYTYKSLKEKKYVEISQNTNKLLVLVSVFSIIIMALGPEIICILGGVRYYDAIWIVPPVAASVFFMFLYLLFVNIEYYFEKTLGITVSTCIAAGINILLNYIFIDIFGYYAAGYTTLICYIILVFCHYIAYKKILNREKTGNVYDVKFIMIISIIEMITMFCMILIYEILIVRYIIIILILLVIVLKRRKFINILKRN